MSQVWEHEPYLSSPFVSYLLCFGLMLIWAIIELYVAIRVDKSVFSTIVAAMTATTLAVLFLGFFHFWQFMRILDSDIPSDNYLVKLIEPPMQTSSYVGSLFPTWKGYLTAERCEKGMAISTITDEERIELHKGYEIFLEKTFNSSTEY